MDATTGATIVASVINSSSLNCSSSSSSNSSSGYGSSHSAASTPIGGQYETSTHTPVSATTTEHVPPTATVAPVVPCYSETALGQQQRQQYYQTYAYPTAAAAGQYPIYDAFTGNSYHNLTTPSVERSLGLSSGHHSSSSSGHSQQQRLEKSSSKSTSSGTQLYTSSAAVSLTTTTSSTTKPQATATPFFAQPSSNVSASSAYYDTYGKYKMPSSTKLPSHAATDYASHLQHAVASLSYQHQQQHYYAAAKSQLQDANYSAAVKPQRHHSVNNATAYYGNSSAYYDKYDKYMYPPTAGSAAYATPTHAAHPYSPHEPATADPYRKVAAAAAANAWHWNMEYAAGNCRNLPPTAAGSSYLTAGATTGSTRDAYCATGNDKYSKYDKYGAYAYASAHHQQYITPQTTVAASSRSLWSNTAHHTPHLASVQHGLNERLTHTLPPSAAQHQYPHTHPHATHHHFASASGASSAQRPSCCAQPYQQNSCYYPRPSQQHTHASTTNPYAPPQQTHYGNGGGSSTSGSHKYGSYSSSFKPNSSNELFVTSPFETTPTPNYNYGTTSAARYGATNSAFYNDLNMQTAFDGYASNGLAPQPPASMLQQHNVSAHLGYQSHGSSQNPTTSSLLDYRKPTPVTNEYCLNKSRAPTLSAMEQHLGPAGFLTFDINGNPIAQTHSVITSPTIYSDTGSSSDKSTPTTKNIRDFLATWSEGEDEESAAAASAAEHLSFTPVQNRAYGLSENVAHRHAVAARPKIHVGITVDGSLVDDSSQFINLPDIVIDIEKPNATANETNEAPTVAPAAAAVELTASQPPRTATPQISACGHNHSHEIFENFDAEKELDELEIKRAKLCLEKQLNNEIRILTPEPTEPEPAKLNEQQPQALQYANLATVHHSDCEKSYERPHTFLKEMELSDSTSHSSNGSTFEKEYETFINRIENDKNVVESQHHVCPNNEPLVVESELPIINEDSGSLSHQSSGIKTPPDPTDIDELAQKVSLSVKSINFAGKADFETRDCENFSDCVHDLTTSQKSMDESMVLQNFQCPAHLAENASANVAKSEVNENTNNLIQPEDLSVSRDGLAADKSSSNKNLTPNAAASLQPEDFSIFYKKKRKLVYDFQESETNSAQMPPSKHPKPLNETKPKMQQLSIEAKSKRKLVKTVAKLRQKLNQRQKRYVSFFYKNLRPHLAAIRRVNTNTLVKQHLALLKERHLPLIKRQSIKNFSTCDKLLHNPRSLKSLIVSILNTNEFHSHLLDDFERKNCLKVEKKAQEVETKILEAKNVDCDAEIPAASEKNIDSQSFEIKKVTEIMPEVTKTIEEIANSPKLEDLNISAAVDTAQSFEEQEKKHLESKQADEESKAFELQHSSRQSTPPVEDDQFTRTAGSEPLDRSSSPKTFNISETEEKASEQVVCFAAQNSLGVIKEVATEVKENSGYSVSKALETAETSIKTDNLTDALEEQSSATVSDNWSASVKLQEEFSGFEDESSSKRNFITTSNSSNADSVVELETSVNQPKPALDEASKAKELEPATTEETNFQKTDFITQVEVLSPLEERAAGDDSTAAKTALQEATTPPANPPSLSLTNFSSSSSNEQTNKIPPMRTKASVKMCDFSNFPSKCNSSRQRSKSKSLNSLKLTKSNKRSLRSLDAQKPNSISSIQQKPTFAGIGKIDKTKFVENWAASINSSAETASLDSLMKSQVAVKSLDLPLFDETSSSSSSSTSSSSASGDNQSDTSSNSTQTTKNKAASSSASSSTTTISNQSSSSDSSSSDDDSDSEFNEMRALERELSQHKTHDDWANSVAKICQAETDEAKKTDSIKIEIVEVSEVTNQDIADLKKILESEAEEEEIVVAQTIEAGKVCEAASNEQDKLRENEKSNDETKRENVEAEAVVDLEQQPQQPQIVIPKLSDLCKFALNSSFVVNELNVNLNNKNEKEIVAENKNEVVAAVAAKAAAANHATNQQKVQQEEKEEVEVEEKINTNPPKSPKPTKVVDEEKIELAEPQQQQPHSEHESTAMTVEEQLAEMYRQAGVVSDPEDNNDDCGMLSGENYTENHAQDYLLINLAEILANADNESNVFVLQCDMNENVLRVMTTSPNGDNSNELVIGEVSNVDVENSSAVQIVQLVETAAMPTLSMPTAIQSPSQPPPPPPTQPPPPPPPLPPSPPPAEDITAIPSSTSTASPLVQYTYTDDSHDGNHDLPIIHHEEIVPDNYKKYQKEQFFKYLQAKYAQKHVKRFYHAHRISKKYRRRYLSKMFSNSLALLTLASQQRSNS